MPGQSAPSAVATIGIDIGKNTFHLAGLDQRGAIVLKLKSTREQLERHLANLPRCLIGMAACSGSLEPRLIATMYIVQRIGGHPLAWHRNRLVGRFAGWENRENLNS